jgi:pentatricopeptide repeat protein
MSVNENQNSNMENLKGYYAYSYLTLSDGNYRNAVNGFKYTLKNGIEPEKSAIGLICAYSCLGNYNKALSLYNEYRDMLIFNMAIRHKLVTDLSYFLSKDQTALNLKRRNYLSSIRLNFIMNKICENHPADSANIVSIVFLSFWLAYAGYMCDSTAEAARNCLYMRTLDDGFRWKLLGRLSIEDKELLLDDDLAALFSDIPIEIASTDYINTLILSQLFKGNLENARNKIELYRNKGQIFTNELMWNFVKLSVEEDEVDDLTVNFAKHLIGEGWNDSYLAEVIRFGYANRTRYSVKKEINTLEYFDL